MTEPTNYVIEYHDDRYAWHEMDHFGCVDCAAREFVAITRLPFDPDDIARDLRNGCAFEGVSVRTQRPIRVRCDA